MNYKVTNIRLAGHKWIADVSYWENCECASQTKQVELKSVKRPTGKDFIKSIQEQQYIR